MNWNLDVLYEDFNEEYIKDFNNLEKQINKLIIISNDFTLNNDSTNIKNFLIVKENIESIYTNLYSFCGLNLTVDYKNEHARGFEGKLHLIKNKIIEPNTKFIKYLCQIEEINEIIKKDDLLKEYSFLIKNLISIGKHILSEKEEKILTNMQMFSSISWNNLQSIITSNAKGHFNEEIITLTSIRNLAYHEETETRKKAYEEELKMYEYIEDVAAVTLSNVKREANFVSQIRGFESVLDMTLFYSNMKKSTLDSMITSIKNNLPIFDKYFQAKSKYLNHKNGLPFYDLYAPVGNYKETFSIESANKQVLSSFYEFSEKLGNVAKEAIENEWIDYLPKNNKVGGAFCSNLNGVKQSRILLNFSSSLSDLQTLAHELGHAYHNSVINEEKILNTEYSMLTAETASTLCQLIFTDHIYNQTNDKLEKLYILENQLQEETGSIVDILSRFEFELKVVEETKDKELSSNNFNKIMEEAQKKCYNNNLDPDFLHPYMWICKSHYYSSDLNFYNFPYSFGLLFARGLYRLFKKDKAEFLIKYDQLLRLTGKESLENILKTLDIDTTKTDFFDDSLKEIEKKIDDYVKLINEL